MRRKQQFTREERRERGVVSTYMSTGGWRLFDYWTSRVRPKAGGQPASYPPHVLIITIITIIEIIRTIIKIIITITVIRDKLLILAQIFLADFGQERRDILLIGHFSTTFYHRQVI